MEELHRIHVSGDYDLVVVDTPPARYALDFLDAPQRLTGLLDSQLLRVLFRPAVAMGRTGFRLFRLGSATVLRTIERVSGLEFLRTTSEFLLAFEGMLEGFRARAVETGELLRSSACGFVLVAGPDPLQARLAASFSERLEQEGIELLGLVANRVHTWPGSGAAPLLSASDLVQERECLARRLAEPDPPFDSEQVAAVLVGVASRQARLAGQDAETLRCLAHELRIDLKRVRTIPLLDEDVHALEALAELGSYIFDEPMSERMHGRTA